jgi:hypothetical protein
VMLAFLMLFFIAPAPPDPIAEWNHFEKAVRDQTIPKAEVRKQFPELYAKLKNFCAGYPFSRGAAWIFPLQGYGIRDAGSGGFKPNIRYGSSPIRGYDFYDGNRHGGHPAYDIFIRDKNQDGLDDRSQKPVQVLAPVDLLILGTETGWKAGSEIRGGNYVWALDPGTNLIFYFAHLDVIHVHAGSFCRAGSRIGTVGRTGQNAAPSRSPTHLHLMVLEAMGSDLIPVDYVPFLKTATNSQH